jgi:hypothetical protein
MKKAFYVFILTFLLYGCINHADDMTENSGKINKSNKDNLTSYFGLDTSDEHYNKNYSYIFEINNSLKLKNIIDTSVNLEIRIFKGRAFDTTFLYQLQLANDNIWSGKVCSLEYISNRKLFENKFVPAKGWSSFENALVSSDILNLDIDKIKFPVGTRKISYELHAVWWSFQVITPKSSKIIDFGNFNGNLKTFPEMSEMKRMKLVMESLFEINK